MPEDDSQARDDRPERAEEIRDHVRERRTHVDVLATAPAEHDSDRQVDHEPGGRRLDQPGGDEHPRLPPAPYGFDADPDADQRERYSVQERREDFGAAIPERRLRAARTHGEA